jgi:CopA family copper-resistance protein
MKMVNRQLNRRKFIMGATAATILPWNYSSNAAPAPNSPDIPELRGKEFNLSIGETPVNFTGRQRRAITVNGTVPGPVLRVREGDTVTINVTNTLKEDTSIHWHGIILPSNMDGVPGLSFDGIKPGETFSYRFTLQQSGTYWYHSHSAYQEALGLYGTLLIEPKEPLTSQYDREHVVLLSDWSDENPASIYKKLKKLSHYYNNRERTVIDWFKDVDEQGLSQTLSERHMWNVMRMSDSDLADVTGRTYSYLMNGCTPETAWLGQFQAGEKVRLRVINGSSMSIFDFRIPGLKMTIVASDGQEVQPIEVDEFRIGTAETYDVIVEPEAGAYTLFAQSIDRSGYVFGTLTSDISQKASIPSMDYRVSLSHSDMGMDHQSHEEMDHNAHNQHSQHLLGLAGMGAKQPNIVHAASEYGPHVDMLVEAPSSGLTDPGVGLREHQQRYGRRVLNYGDLRNVHPTRDKRQPTREIQLHLTGNMNRYMWSMNGIKFADSEPLTLQHGERVRIVLVNDTMMTHPIHLHGLWSELETGDGDYIPRKHTVLVQPGSTISYLVTADAEGRWAYHCHLLYHMAGMFREVRVSKGDMQQGGQHEHH